MDRFFPRHRRRTWLASAVLGLVGSLVASLVLANAQADDLDDQQSKAQQQVRGAQAALEESSAVVEKAARKLAAARTQLADARRTLAETRGQLAAAQVLDRQMQARLVQAEAALDTATNDLAQGRRNAANQRAELGRLAASSAEAGDPRLMGLSMVLRAQDPNDLATQLSAMDSLLDRGTVVFERMKAAQAALAAQKARVAAARETVAQQRQEAAVNLARKQRLERQAETVAASISGLVEANRQAALTAQRARQADARRLLKSKREEERIKQLILERAQDQKGGYQGAAQGYLARPVDGYITSPYGYRRHPIYGYYGLHNGTDFHAPCGTPMRAGATGTVIASYYSDVWGNRLFLDVGRFNGKAMTLVYNHISAYRAREGQRVGRGDVVAFSGNTGWSTACHLHFSVMLDGQYVDPERFF